MMLTRFVTGTKSTGTSRCCSWSKARLCTSGTLQRYGRSQADHDTLSQRPTVARAIDAAKLRNDQTALELLNNAQKDIEQIVSFRRRSPGRSSD